MNGKVIQVSKNPIKPEEYLDEKYFDMKSEFTYSIDLIEKENEETRSVTLSWLGYNWFPVDTDKETFSIGKELLEIERDYRYTDFWDIIHMMEKTNAEEYKQTGSFNINIDFPREIQRILRGIGEGLWIVDLDVCGTPIVYYEWLNDYCSVDTTYYIGSTFSYKEI